MKEMTYEEFKNAMPEMNDNFSNEWRIDKFKIVCTNCQSDKCFVFLGTDLIGGGGGCETCGHGGESKSEINITVKCGSCGTAMIIKRHNEAETER